MVKTRSSQHRKPKDGPGIDIIRQGFQKSMICISKDLVENLANMHKQMSDFSKEREANVTIGNEEFINLA